MSADELNVDGELDAASTLLTRLKFIVLGGGFFLVFVAGTYFYNFRGPLEKSADKWGQFGDFIGGTLNPVFGFLALIALLSTIAIQVRELRISTRELRNSAQALAAQNLTLRQQNFETSFFQLLRLHNEIVNGIDLVSNNGHVTRGRDCFRVFVNRLNDDLDTFATNGDQESITLAYGLFYRKHQHEIGHYFRLLYNIVKLVKRTDSIDKRYYTNLVRAQLSSYELILLFYNCLSIWGRDKFKPLVEEFAFLKTYPTDMLPNKRLVEAFDASAFGGEYPTSWP